MKAKYDVLESEDHLFRVVPTSDLLAALVFFALPAAAAAAVLP